MTNAQYEAHLSEMFGTEEEEEEEDVVEPNFIYTDWEVGLSGGGRIKLRSFGMPHIDKHAPLPQIRGSLVFYNHQRQIIARFEEWTYFIKT